jgi:hypothetical protein
MQRFKSQEQAQAFLSAHAFIHGHFHPRRHLLTADAYRTIRSSGLMSGAGRHTPDTQVTRAGWLSGATACPSEVTVTMPKEVQKPPAANQQP